MKKKRSSTLRQSVNALLRCLDFERTESSYASINRNVVPIIGTSGPRTLAVCAGCNKA